jgi:hypothetical protein
MTLSIAWKDKQFISFSSDSRISNSLGKHTDVGIKVMSIPVRIDNPIPSETRIESTAYQHRIGICYCGDTLAAHLIKETLQEQLLNLQFLPLYNVLSFDSICELIGKVGSEIATSIKADLDWDDPSVELLVGGYCPDESRLKVNWMRIVSGVDGFKADFQEVLKNEGDYVVLGSGKAKADALIAKDLVPPNYKLMGVLRKVCLDDSEPTVGGFIQYGRFVGQDFHMMGVQDFRIDDKGGFEIIYTWRGTNLFSTDAKYGTDSLVLTGNFIMPFHDEINDTLWGKGNWPPK